MFMKTIDAVKERLFQLCTEHNTNPNALASSAAIPPSTIKNILYDVTQNPGVVTIKKICDGLDISLIEFFDCELFRNLDQEIE